VLVQVDLAAVVLQGLLHVGAVELEALGQTDQQFLGQQILLGVQVDQRLFGDVGYLQAVHVDVFVGGAGELLLQVIVEQRALLVVLEGIELFPQRINGAAGGLLAQGLQRKVGVLLAGQVVVVVTAGAVVRLEGVVLFLVAPDDDQRVEVEGRALLAVYLVVAVGVEGVLDAVGVLAVGCQWEHVGGGFQHQPGGGVEDVPAEVEDERRKDEDEPPLPAGVAHHVDQPLIVEGGFVDDPGAYFGIVLEHFLQAEGVFDFGDVLSAVFITPAKGQGVVGVVGKAAGV